MTVINPYLSLENAMARASALSVALAFLAAACSAVDSPAFYNPANGAIAECVPSDLDPFLDQCISTYRRAGWVKFTAPIISRETPPSSSSP
jgi:hypothetical protein